MFDVGFSELFLLSLIGLLVLGPERLPGVARTIGGFVRKARASWISLRNTIESELNDTEIIDPIKRASKEFRRVSNEIRDIPGFSRELPGTKDPDTAMTKPEPSGHEAPAPVLPAADSQESDD